MMTNTDRQNTDDAIVSQTWVICEKLHGIDLCRTVRSNPFRTGTGITASTGDADESITANDDEDGSAKYGRYDSIADVGDIGKDVQGND